MHQENYDEEWKHTVGLSAKHFPSL